MSHRDGKCDNPNCGVDVKEGEGEFWITGDYFCKKCHKQWSDNYDRVIKSALQRDSLENVEKIDSEKKVEKKEEKVIKKSEKKKWFE